MASGGVGGPAGRLVPYVGRLARLTSLMTDCHCWGGGGGAQVVAGVGNACCFQYVVNCTQQADNSVNGWL